MKDDHIFSGFDAYKKVIDSGVDVVILTTPPHFRSEHLKYAIEKGKHAFVEKPVATDVPRVHEVMATCEEAKKKKLAVVSGLCWRYAPKVKETVARVQDGAIGDIVAIESTTTPVPNGTKVMSRNGAAWNTRSATGCITRGWGATTSWNRRFTAWTKPRGYRAMPARSGRGHGRPAAANRQEIWQHLRPPYGVLRISERRAGVLHLPAAR